MTVQLLEAIRVAGAEQIRGAVLDFNAGVESDLIAAGKAKPVRIGVAGYAIFGDEVGYRAPTFAAGAGATLNASGIERIGDDVCAWMSITGISGTANYVEMKFASLSPFICRGMQFEYSISNVQSGHEAIAYALDNDSSPVKFMLSSHSPGAATTNTPWGHSGRAAAGLREGDFTKTGFSDSANHWQMTGIKFRVPVLNGQTQLFRLFLTRTNTRRKKGRLIAYADDGYARWMRLGLPVAEEFGIPMTLAIIPSLVGSSASYVDWASLRRAVAAGHEVVAHGPEGGAGNLFSRWATDAEALADMVNTRNQLVVQGVMRDLGRRCYVWPQGQFTRTAGDPSFLERALDAGFDCGRSASSTNRGIFFSALSPRNHQRLMLPVIGHQTAATLDGDTTDDAAETTNINTLITRIQDMAAAGQDVHLMLHDVVQRGGATSTLTIETDRLRTLFAAIAAEVAANRLECVCMSDLLV